MIVMTKPNTVNGPGERYILSTNVLIKYPISIVSIFYTQLWVLVHMYTSNVLDIKEGVMFMHGKI